MTVPEFVAELDLPGHDVFDLEWRISEGQGALMTARIGLSPEAVQAMTFRDWGLQVRMMIARKTRHRCPLCPEEVHRKSAALPWVFRCSVHGTDLLEPTGSKLSKILGEGQMAKLEPFAITGAAVLNAWAGGTEQGASGARETLAFLTARHRRASPPTVAEQPRMSLQTRRDYHDFLTTPILRQALTIIVPEYDQVAPILAKPVRPGLHALAQGSLLQAFALTVGIGRIAENPVDQAISVLLKSDAEGQGRIQEALQSWPLSIRRRISARFWRAERDESACQIAETAARRRQSHKYRFIQSHEYRSRIS